MTKKAARTKLRKTEYWYDLLGSLWKSSHEPFEMDGVIIRSDIIIFDCPICGRHKHIHGHTPDELPGMVTSRMSHCTGINVPILIRLKAPKADDAVAAGGV